jgi:hypothetical protein
VAASDCESVDYDVHIEQDQAFAMTPRDSVAPQMLHFELLHVAQNRTLQRG